MKKIAVAGLIGYETAKALYEENREALEARFPKFWLKKFLEAGPKAEELMNEQNREVENGAVIEITEGGLFGALWEACEQQKAEGCANGCEVWIENVPILQEVVEISELFDINPYEASSKGSFLIVEEEEKIRNHSGQLTIIGTMQKKKDRVVVMKDKETKRFLTPPERQAKDLANR
ncbi:MAG: hypothetical protein MJ086_04850 [Lachnospiraceae bacterium]|nr:hypothetical protein [Lachnospiraceae bacterium]